MIAYLLLAAGDSWTGLGLILIWGGFFTVLWALVDVFGGVEMGPDPVLPDAPTQEIQRVGAETYVWPTTPMPNYVPYVDAFVQDVHDAETVVFEITADMVVDPLAATVEIQRIEDTPLFFTIKHPKPFELETFTSSWTRERIERIKEMKP